ncbi:MAG: hypothetical protein A3J38_02705 [Gammaproteobacteria bacterium RIFCSPHIGHO2_12_FULL_45_9]|nr:MAG: hypothetical protein A3J38_02705 [Gammaproteobacteria bacterium RIFCSPHIGHO2_12_FULL_45_9]
MFKKATELSQRVYYHTGELLPILSPGWLEQVPQFSAYIEEVAILADLPDAHFTALYTQFLVRFGDYVQSLPRTLEEPLWSMLSTALSRGLHYLQTWVAHSPESDSRERYVLFTGGVLQRIGRLLATWRINVRDREQESLGYWQPLLGPVYAIEHAFHILLFPYGWPTTWGEEAGTVWLARSLLGDMGFQWIAEDAHLLMEWIGLLHGGSHELQRFTQVIQQQPDPAWQFEVEWPRLVVEAEWGIEQGLAFYLWLMDRLDKENLLINTEASGIHVVPEGIFLEKPGVFKLFSDSAGPEFHNTTAFLQFARLLGISLAGSPHFQFEKRYSSVGIRSAGEGVFASPLGAYQRAIREGILMRDIGWLKRTASQLGLSPHVGPAQSRSPAVLPVLAQSARRLGNSHK